MLAPAARGVLPPAPPFCIPSVSGCFLCFLASSQIGELLAAAKSRWLRAGEVGEILLHYRSFAFKLSGEPPTKPAGGPAGRRRVGVCGWPFR